MFTAYKKYLGLYSPGPVWTVCVSGCGSLNKVFLYSNCYQVIEVKLVWRGTNKTKLYLKQNELKKKGEEKIMKPNADTMPGVKHSACWSRQWGSLAN